jgi:hypothetical protein
LSIDDDAHPVPLVGGKSAADQQRRLDASHGRNLLFPDSIAVLSVG